MKKILLAISIFIFNFTFGQTTKFTALMQYNSNDNCKSGFIINGKGNVGNTDFDEFNGSGKLDADFLINKGDTDKKFLYLNVGLNRNATNNNDTNFISSIIFPELGQFSLAGSINHFWKINTSYKNIKVILGTCGDINIKRFTKQIDSNKTKLSFDNLNYTVSVPMYLIYANDKMPLSLGMLPNFTWHNIANENNKNFQKMILNDNIKNGMFSAGIKIEIVINNKYVINADAKQVWYNNSNNTSNEDDKIKGFQLNIGTTIRGAIFNNTTENNTREKVDNTL